MVKQIIPILSLVGPVFILIAGLGATSSDKNDPFLPFLFAAYTLTWIGFFSYAFFLHRKQKDLAAEIKQLKTMIPNQTSSPRNPLDKD